MREVDPQSCHHKLTLTTQTRHQECVEAYTLSGSQHSADVGMREASDNPEGIGIGNHGAFPGEWAPHIIDGAVGQVGEISDGLVLDLSVLTSGSAQEYGPVDLAVVGPSDDLDMYLSGLRLAHSRLVVKTGSPEPGHNIRKLWRPFWLQIAHSTRPLCRLRCVGLIFCRAAGACPNIRMWSDGEAQSV